MLSVCTKCGPSTAKRQAGQRIFQAVLLRQLTHQAAKAKADDILDAPLPDRDCKEHMIQ